MQLNPIDQLEPLVIVAVAVIFTLTFVALRRLFVLPYIDVLNEREAKLTKADAQAEEARALADGAEQEAASAVEAARVEADRLLREAAEGAAEYRKVRLEAATVEASERLQAGRAKIGEARESETRLLRHQAVECVGLACERLLGASDPDAVDAAVDKLMARRVR